MHKAFSNSFFDSSANNYDDWEIEYQLFGLAKISCSEILKIEVQIASLVMISESNCLPHYSHTQIATCIICYTIGLLTIGRQEDWRSATYKYVCGI